MKSNLHHQQYIVSVMFDELIPLAVRYHRQDILLENQ